MQLGAAEIVKLAKRLELLLANNGVPAPNPPNLPNNTKYFKQVLKGAGAIQGWGAGTFILFVGKINSTFRTTLDPNKSKATVTIGDVLQAIVNQKQGDNPPNFWP